MFSVAIDGPAGAGKGTVSSFIAAFFNLKHLDTGLLYREVARLVVLNNIPLSSLDSIIKIAESVDVNLLNANILRTENISSFASQIAVIPEVRSILTGKMKNFINTVDYNYYRGVVLDGRDVGTSILPNADVKIFITADSTVRALRRKIQIQEDSQVELVAILKGIEERDQRDKTRVSTPLEAASDSIILDTTFMNVDQACDEAIKIVGAKFKSKKKSLAGKA